MGFHAIFWRIFPESHWKGWKISLPTQKGVPCIRRGRPCIPQRARHLFGSQSCSIWRRNNGAKRNLLTTAWPMLEPSQACIIQMTTLRASTLVKKLSLLNCQSTWLFGTEATPRLSDRRSQDSDSIGKIFWTLIAQRTFVLSCQANDVVIYPPRHARCENFYNTTSKHKKCI